MRMKAMFATVLGGTLLVAAPVLADGPRTYAVHSNANYCPAGLQPITISGVICCGTPNQSVSYNQMLAHAAPRKHTPRKVYSNARADCPVGTKGCTYD